MELWQGIWCLTGDFNVVRYPNERTSCDYMTMAMTEFSKFIFQHNHLDFPLPGGSFTWSNNQDSPTLSRLDRFLVSSGWEEDLFSDSVQLLCHRLVLDHFPILLDCGGMRRGARSFKFENMWLNSEGFVEKVRNWW